MYGVLDQIERWGSRSQDQGSSGGESERADSIIEIENEREGVARTLVAFISSTKRKGKGVELLKGSG